MSESGTEETKGSGGHINVENKTLLNLLDDKETDKKEGLTGKIIPYLFYILNWKF